VPQMSIAELDAEFQGMVTEWTAGRETNGHTIQSAYVVPGSIRRSPTLVTADVDFVLIDGTTHRGDVEYEPDGHDVWGWLGDRADPQSGRRSGTLVSDVP
jgi:hypothetical protein